MKIKAKSEPRDLVIINALTAGLAIETHQAHGYNIIAINDRNPIAIQSL